jgi:hypothetical protein
MAGGEHNDERVKSKWHCAPADESTIAGRNMPTRKEEPEYRTPTIAQRRNGNANWILRECRTTHARKAACPRRSGSRFDAVTRRPAGDTES